MERHPVKSTNVESVGYNPEEKIPGDQIFAMAEFINTPV